MKLFPLHKQNILLLPRASRMRCQASKSDKLTCPTRREVEKKRIKLFNYWSSINHQVIFHGKRQKMLFDPLRYLCVCGISKPYLILVVTLEVSSDGAPVRPERWTVDAKLISMWCVQLTLMCSQQTGERADFWIHTHVQTDVELRRNLAVQSVASHSEQHFVSK